MRKRDKRNIWTYVQSEASQGVPPYPKEGQTWFDPSNDTYFLYNGAAWEPFVFGPELTEYQTGFVCGGNSSMSIATQIDRLYFATESVSILSTGLNTAVSAAQSGQSLIAGYLCGGSPTLSPTVTSAIQKLSFDLLEVSVLTSQLNVGRVAGASVQNLDNLYIVGGSWSGSANDLLTGIEKLNFLSENTALVGTNLASPTRGSSGVSSSFAGYICGGDRSNNTVFLSEVSKLSFAAEACALLASTVTQSTNKMAVGGLDAGFACGGFTGTVYLTNLDKLVFATDSSMTISTGLIDARAFGCPVTSLKTGYLAGGQTHSAAYISSLDRLDFTTITVGRVTSTLTASNAGARALSV